MAVEEKYRGASQLEKASDAMTVGEIFHDVTSVSNYLVIFSLADLNELFELVRDIGDEVGNVVDLT